MCNESLIQGKDCDYMEALHQVASKSTDNVSNPYFVLYFVITSMLYTVLACYEET